MKKIIAVSATVVFAIVTLGPLTMGFFTAHKINQVVRNTKTIASEYGNITINKYQFERGWFSSKISLSGTIKQSANSTLQILTKNGNPFHITGKIKHGPMNFIADLYDPIQINAALLTATGSIDMHGTTTDMETLPIEVVSSISYTGKFNHYVKLPGHEQQLSPMLKISWLDADMQLFHDSKLNDLDFEIDVDRVDLWHTLMGQITFKDLSINETQGEKNTTFLALHIISDVIEIKDIAKNTINIDEVSIELVASQDHKQETNMFFYLDFVNLTAASLQNFSASLGLKVDGLEFTNTDNINSDTPLAIEEQIFKAIGSKITQNTNITLSPIKITHNDEEAAFEAEIKPIFPWPNSIQNITNTWALAKKIKLSAISTQGITNNIASYILTLIARKQLLDAADHSKPKSYLENTVSISKKEVADALVKWQQAGLLDKQESLYSLDFTYSDQKFKINGNWL